jgi:hypothetical protein
LLAASESALTALRQQAQSACPHALRTPPCDPRLASTRPGRPAALPRSPVRSAHAGTERAPFQAGTSAPAHDSQAARPRARPPNSRVGGYDLGNFIYVNKSDGINDHLAHEGGHTLNNAAFGGIFHWIGAWDENLWPFENGGNAFAEKVADSHDPTTTDNPNAWYMLWA